MRESSLWGIGRRVDQHIELAANALADMGASMEQAFHAFDASHSGTVAEGVSQLAGKRPR